MSGEASSPVDSTPSLSPAQTLVPLRVDRSDAEVQSATSERNIVKEADGYTYIDWQDDDVHHPFNWSLRKKWLNTFVGLLFNAVTAMNATGYSATIRQGAMELKTSREIYATGTTAYMIPVAIAPLILSPLSETWGRRPLYVVALFVYMMMYIPQALAPNIAAILCSRFAQGCLGSVGNTMVAGTIADMFPKENRSLPMGVFVVCVFWSQAISSAASAWTVANPLLGWRWIFWWQAIVTLAVFVLVVCCLSETRADILLIKRVEHLNKIETGRSTKYRTEHQDEIKSFIAAAARNLTRPIKFFVTEPIIAFLALWIGFLWGVVFLSLRGVPVAFSAYGWTEPQKSTVLLTIGIGGSIGFLTNLHQNTLYQKARSRGGGRCEPEARLYWAMPAAVLTAGGLLWYGWGTQSFIHPVVGIFGLIIFSWGTFIIYLGTLNYIADTYETFASSGVACQALLRNILGGCFPLFSEGMYNDLTPPIASTVLGGIAAFLGIAPFILFFYGTYLRKHSLVLSQLARQEEEKESGAAAKSRRNSTANNTLYGVKSDEEKKVEETP